MRVQRFQQVEKEINDLVLSQCGCMGHTMLEPAANDTNRNIDLWLMPITLVFSSLHLQWFPNSEPLFFAVV